MGRKRGGTSPKSKQGRATSERESTPGSTPNQGAPEAHYNPNITLVNSEPSVQVATTENAPAGHSLEEKCLTTP
jgi:hypothetical protein